MDKNNIKINLTLYGADLHNWPKDIRIEALKAVASSKELLHLVQDEKDFEVLLNLQVIPEVSSDLAQRIITQTKPNKCTNAHWLSELKSIFFIPTPACTIVAITLSAFSFFLGTTDFFVLEDTEVIPLEAPFYDRGEIL